MRMHATMWNEKEKKTDDENDHVHVHVNVNVQRDFDTVVQCTKAWRLLQLDLVVPGQRRKPPDHIRGPDEEQCRESRVSYFHSPSNVDSLSFTVANHEILPSARGLANLSFRQQAGRAKRALLPLGKLKRLRTISMRPHTCNGSRHTNMGRNSKQRQENR